MAKTARPLSSLDRTPFYGESGGQVGDQGTIDGDGFAFHVTDTQKDGDVFLHYGYLSQGALQVGADVHATVDPSRRDGIRRAHSATHVLHYALQKNLGTHAQQQGSKVDDDWLRFDFTNMSPVTPEQTMTIEQDVRHRVEAAEPIHWEVLPLPDAREAGAMMLFGEKYPDPVRMVSMGEFSKELCGGTHLENTHEVGDFDILAEEGVSAGTRRITALTGPRATRHIEQVKAEHQQAVTLLQVAPEQLIEGITHLQSMIRERKKQLSSGKTEDLPTLAKATSIGHLSYDAIKQSLKEAARMLNVALFEVTERIEGMQREAQSLSRNCSSWHPRGTCPPMPSSRRPRRRARPC